MTQHISHRQLCTGYDPKNPKFWTDFWTSEDSYLILNPHSEKVTGLKSVDIIQNLPELSGHIWMATSGSSSHAKIKLVALSKSAFLASAKAVNQHLKVSSKDIWYKVLPSFHVGGLSIYARAYLSHSPVQDGYLDPHQKTPKWSAQNFLESFKKNQATLVSMVPTQIYDVLKEEFLPPPQLRAVVVGGAALDTDLYLKACSKGWPLLPSYGMTETASQVATAPLSSWQQQKWPGLELLPHIETSLIHTSQEEQATSLLQPTHVQKARKKRLEGELLLKGPMLYSAEARLENDGWTVQLRDPTEWFSTQDRVRIQENKLEILGRLNDEIKIAGERVDLAELRQHLQSVVREEVLKNKLHLIGSPNSRRGSQVDLVVVSRSHFIHLGSKRMDIFTAIEPVIKAFNTSVIPLARIQNIYFLDDLKLTPLDKVDKKSLYNQLGWSLLNSTPKTYG